MSDSVRPHRWQPTRLPRPWDSPGKNTGVGCHFLLQCMKGKSESEVAQSCPTLCNSMACSLPGSSTRGIFQARVLEWVAIALGGINPLNFFYSFSDSLCEVLFFFFWSCWLFNAACRLSIVSTNRGCSSLLCTGFSLFWLLLLQSMGSRSTGFSSFSPRALELGLSSWAHGLSRSKAMESSQTRNQIHVPCIGRWILIHHTTKEAHFVSF